MTSICILSFVYATASIASNQTLGDGNLCLASPAHLSNCNEDGTSGKQYKDWLSMGIVFMGIFVVGIGSTFIYAFGIPFLDDNAGKENSPLALAFAMTSRIVGPAIGYSLGAVILKIFVYPGESPDGKCLDVSKISVLITSHLP